MRCARWYWGRRDRGKGLCINKHGSTELREFLETVLEFISEIFVACTRFSALQQPQQLHLHFYLYLQLKIYV